MSIPKNILLINTFETFVIFSEKKFDENSQLFRRSHAKFTFEKKIHRNASRYSDDSSSALSQRKYIQRSHFRLISRKGFFQSAMFLASALKRGSHPPENILKI